MFVFGIVPSGICLLLLLFATDGNKKIWHMLKFVAFFVFFILNWLGWMRDKAKHPDTREFYYVNGTVWGVYTAVSLAGIFLLGYVVYTLIFAQLRTLEVFEENPFLRKTVVSVAITNLVMLGSMIVCERISDKKVDVIRKALLKGVGDEVEVEEEKVEATKQNKSVQELSAAELIEQEEHDMAESAAAIRSASEEMPDAVVDEGVSKGRGDKVEFVDIENIDDDLTEGDFNPKAAAEKEYRQNEQYGEGTLWNTDIYKGGGPITDYSDDYDEVPPNAANTDDTEDEGLWDARFYRGRDKSRSVYDEEEDEKVNTFADYGEDSLWSADMHRGREGAKDNKGSIEDYIRETDGEDTPENVNEPYTSDDLWDIERK